MENRASALIEKGNALQQTIELQKSILQTLQDTIQSLRNDQQKAVTVYEQSLEKIEFLTERISQKNTRHASGSKKGVNHYSDMTSEEQSKLIDELFSHHQSDQTHISSLMSRLEAMSESYLSMQNELKGLRSDLSELLPLLRSKDAQNAVLQKEIARLTTLLQVPRK